MEKIRNVLEKYVNSASPLQSPFVEDFQRKVEYAKDGTELVSFVSVSNADLVLSNGSAAQWSLNALVSAGVDPNFSISTGYNTRLDGLHDLELIVSQIDSIKDSPSVSVPDDPVSPVVEEN